MGDRAHDRLVSCPYFTQVLSTLIMGFVGLAYGTIAAADTYLDSYFRAAPYVFLAAFGLTGWVATAIMWHSWRAAFLRELREAARENLLDRGLLLMALEPVPNVALLNVFEVPDRERTGLGVMALPQAPRALNTQKFATRLRLLRDRYPACCKALGLDPWPRNFMRLQLDVELGGIYLPVISVALIGLMVWLNSILDLAQSITLLIPAVLLSLLVLRWALGDILRALAFAALNGTIVAVLLDHNAAASEARPEQLAKTATTRAESS